MKKNTKKIVTNIKASAKNTVTNKAKKPIGKKTEKKAKK